MAYSGQTLENPASGERITVRQTAARDERRAAGDRPRAPRGRRVPGPCTSTLSKRSGSKSSKARCGSGWAASGSSPGPARLSSSPPARRTTSRTSVTTRRSSASRCGPALKMEQLFETAVGLAEEGRTMLGGIPKPLDLALFTGSSRTRCRRHSHRAGCSASCWARWPGSPGAAPAAACPVGGRGAVRGLARLRRRAEETERTEGAAMNTHKPTLVLGGTGKTGRRVAERLTARGVPVRIGSRSGEPPFDWEDRVDLGARARGRRGRVHLLLPGPRGPRRGRDGAARSPRSRSSSGVRRLVLLSGRGEEEAQRAEQAVQDVRRRLDDRALQLVRAELQRGLPAGRRSWPARSRCRPATCRSRSSTSTTSPTSRSRR